MTRPQNLDVYPVTTQVGSVRPGDRMYLGGLIEFTVHTSTPGFGRTHILTGRVPADHPLNGSGSEVSLEVEDEHRVIVYRPLDTVLDEARARSDAAWAELTAALDSGDGS